MLTRKDLFLVTIIGAAVGLLVQPVLSNVIRGNAALTVHAAAVHAAAFFGLIVLAPAALFIASLVGRVVPVLYQFAKFAAVGSLNTMVDLGAFNLETLALGSKPPGLLFAAFKAVSFFCATTNSYFWNKKWTFGSQTAATSGEALKFYSIAVIGGLLNVGVATYVFGVITPPASFSAGVWTNVVSPAAGILAAFLWDFLGYKFLVFRKREAAAI